jgi:hypothetical protein
MQSRPISYTSDFGVVGFAVNGPGNEFALFAVPEPRAAASLLAGWGTILGVRRRRR